MKNDLKYKGYRAAISYDSDDKLFVGDVIGISDSLSFHGSTANELEESFRNCIDNYLDNCAAIGKEPQKSYSGSFNVRVSPAIHATISEYAACNDMSLNQVVSDAINMYVATKC